MGYVLHKGGTLVSRLSVDRAKALPIRCELYRGSLHCSRWDTKPSCPSGRFGLRAF